MATYSILGVGYDEMISTQQITHRKFVQRFTLCYFATCGDRCTLYLGGSVTRHLGLRIPSGMVSVALVHFFTHLQVLFAANLKRGGFESNPFLALREAGLWWRFYSDDAIRYNNRSMMSDAEADALAQGAYADLGFLVEGKPMESCTTADFLAYVLRPVRVEGRWRWRFLRPRHELIGRFYRPDVFVVPKTPVEQELLTITSALSLIINSASDDLLRHSIVDVLRVVLQKYDLSQFVLPARHPDSPGWDWYMTCRSVVKDGNLNSLQHVADVWRRACESETVLGAVDC